MFSIVTNLPFVIGNFSDSITAGYEDEKSYENDHYSISIIHDKTYLPEEAEHYLLKEYDPASIEIDLQYSSKYAQNSATNLNIAAEFVRGNSSIKADCKLKTAAPWLFMPFEVIDPIEAGANYDVLIAYLTDWISNAASMVHHKEPETKPVETAEPDKDPEETTSGPEVTPESEEQDTDAETAPLSETELE